MKLAILGAVLALAAPAAGAEVTVRMLNGGPGGAMVFDPALVRIAPGDGVRFVPTNRGHNAETITGMAPRGELPFRTAIGREEVVTFGREGVYGVKCGPHYLMGMVGLVVVGSRLDNLEGARAVAQAGVAAARFAPLFAQVP